MGTVLYMRPMPDRPCKASTIKARRHYLRLAASAAVKQGEPIESLCSLADLVSPRIVRQILDHYLAKKGGKIVMTESYRSPPAQKALPLTDWPQADRKAWTDAQVRADVLDDGGIVSHLSPCTLQDLTRRYAYFLYFLAEEAKLNPHGPAAASVTEENVLLYVRYLEPRVSSVTLAQSLYKLSRVAACLGPKQDWRWLKRVARRLDLRAKPRDKRHEVVEIKALFELGVKLMNEAERADNLAPLRRALLYRDGLIIALLAADPLRRANIAALEIGKTLVKDGTTATVSNRQYLGKADTRMLSPVTHNQPSSG
jgi:hypothetical protein